VQRVLLKFQDLSWEMLQVKSNSRFQVDNFGCCSSSVLQGKAEGAVESSAIPHVEDLTLCVACIEQVANVLFIPCEHKVICEHCLCMLDSQLCPCCREQVLSFKLLPVKSKAVEECPLSAPNMEYWTCAEDRTENIAKVSEYLERCGIGNDQFVQTGSLCSSVLQYIGYSEGQELGWFCQYCRNYHCREEIEDSLMYPLGKLIQERNEHERSIVKKTLQVWVCGSSFQVNARLIEVLSNLFPADASYGHNMDDNNKSHAFSKRTATKSLLKLPRWDRRRDSYRDNCPVLNREKPPVNICFQCNKYSPNCVFEGNSICFRNIRTWELLRYAKLKDTWYMPDLLLYCCCDENEQSFYDILGLKRRLKDRYGFVCKELVVLLQNGKHGDMMEQFKNFCGQQYEQTSLSVDSIRKLLKEYEPSFADLLDISSFNLDEVELGTARALMKAIVRRAKIQRKKSNRNNRSWIATQTSAPALVANRNRNNVGPVVVSSSCRCM